MYVFTRIRVLPEEPFLFDQSASPGSSPNCECGDFCGESPRKSLMTSSDPSCGGNSGRYGHGGWIERKRKYCAKKNLKELRYGLGCHHPVLAVQFNSRCRELYAHSDQAQC